MSYDTGAVVILWANVKLFDIHIEFRNVEFNGLFLLSYKKKNDVESSNCVPYFIAILDLTDPKSLKNSVVDGLFFKVIPGNCPILELVPIKLVLLLANILKLVLALLLLLKLEFKLIILLICYFCY